MKKIGARSLLSHTTGELVEMLTGPFILKFDDGVEIETNARETIYSSFGWDFHRDWPETPLLAKHHIKSIIGTGTLGSDTHLKLLGNCMWSTYDQYVNVIIKQGKSEIQFRDMLAEKIYRLTNDLYNFFTHYCEGYVTSLDIVDFVEVVTHPAIKKANDDVQPSKQSIEQTYSVIKDVLFNSPDMDHNPIALASRSKLVSFGQVQQCVGPRGYLTDTDSVEFPNPVLRSYVSGMRKFHDTLIESRSAAKALLFSKSPLQQAEYFSRRLQLMSQIVQNLHMEDCGSKEYLRWKVRAKDLVQLNGKHYLDEDGKLKTISDKNKELIGKTLKLRSVLHCAHPDPYGICSACFGDLSLSVPENTNIGQMCCTSLAQKSSQNVLSVKHLDGSSVVSGITLTEYERKFLKVAPDDNSYILADKLKGDHVKLVISSKQSSNITDIMDVTDVSDLNITRVSELNEIGIRMVVGGVETTEVVIVSLNGRLASMTYALLGYIRVHGWSVDENGNYIIDMKDWDWSKEILTLPLRHFNMSDHSRDIASMLESSVDKLQERDHNTSPDAALVELFDLVNDKLNVNLAVLEVVLYASMIRSAENNDFMLPKPWTDKGLGVMRMSMANRSLSAAMAYEGHREIIVNPDSFTNSNRPNHPMDRLVLYY